MQPPDPSGQFEVFHGRADPALAHVYVRWTPAGQMSGPGLSLSGEVRGPISRLARTLPASVPLVNQPAAGTLLACASVPDPCFWMPGAPYLYTVRAEVRDSARVLAQAEQQLGVRVLGIAGRRFRLAGKGWMPRAVHRDLLRQQDQQDASLWREVGAVMIAHNPNDDLCQWASEQGILLFAEIDGDLKTILLTAVHQEPDRRYPSAPAMHGAIAAYLESIWPGRSPS